MFNIYTLDNYNSMLEESVSKYFKMNLKYESVNNQNIIHISENLQTIDSNFSENIAEYKKYFL